MKQIKKFLLLIVATLMFTLNISAATVSTSISAPSSIDAGKTFNVSVSITGNNIWGLTASLNYDSDKLELTKSEGKNGFTATVGKNIVLDATSGHSGTFEVVILTFKAKSNFLPGQTTSILISNIKASDGSIMMSASDVSKTIKVNVPKSTNNNLSSLTVDETLVGGFKAETTTYNLGTYPADKSSINITAVAEDSKATISGTGTKTLNYGANTFSVVVKAENGATKTYQIKVNRTDPRNKDNSLSSLSINPLTISFNKNTTSYTVIAEHDVKSIDIQAKASDAKATITGTGTKTLKDYVNVFKIVVKAENETTKTYTITVNRKDSDGVLGNVSKDNTLKSLSVEGYEIKFDKNTTEYNIEVDSQVTNVKVNAVANHAKAQVKIENTEKLVIGNNKINVVVTAESGTKKTYVINVLRKNNIPVTTLEKLNESIDKLENEKLIVEIKDENNILSKENISKIKKSKKEVTITKYDENNKILYAYEVDGSKVDKVIDLNTEIKFTSTKEDKINNLTNYSEAIFLDFASEESFTSGVKVKINVTDKYKDSQLVNIYQYNEETNEMEIVQKDVQVNNGYVEFKVTNPNDMIITRATLATSAARSIGNNSNMFMITSIVEGIVIIGLIVIVFLKSKRTKEPIKPVVQMPEVIEPPMEPIDKNN